MVSARWMLHLLDVGAQLVARGVVRDVGGVLSLRPEIYEGLVFGRRLHYLGTAAVGKAPVLEAHVGDGDEPSHRVLHPARELPDPAVHEPARYRVVHHLGIPHPVVKGSPAEEEPGVVEYSVVADVPGGYRGDERAPALRLCNPQNAELVHQPPSIVVVAGDDRAGLRRASPGREEVA